MRMGCQEKAGVSVRWKISWGWLGKDESGSIGKLYQEMDVWVVNFLENVTLRSRVWPQK